MQFYTPSNLQIANSIEYPKFNTQTLVIKSNQLVKKAQSHFS